MSGCLFKYISPLLEANFSNIPTNGMALLTKMIPQVGTWTDISPDNQSSQELNWNTVIIIDDVTLVGNVIIVDQ